MKAKADSHDSTSVVYLDPEIVPLLELAYFGIPEAQRKEIDEVVKDGEISRAQAISNHICNQRIKMYAGKGKQNRDDELARARHALRVLAQKK